MRKWLPLVLAVVLIPLACPPAAAQEQTPAPTPERSVRGSGGPVERISKGRASDVAAASVAAAAQRGEAVASGLPQGVRTGDLSARVMRTIEAWNGQPVYVVVVTAPHGAGHVRVIVDAVQGKVLHTQGVSWAWNASPDWWVKGLSAPTTNE